MQECCQCKTKSFGANGSLRRCDGDVWNALENILMDFDILHSQLYSYHKHIFGKSFQNETSGVVDYSSFLFNHRPRASCLLS